MHRRLAPWFALVVLAVAVRAAAAPEAARPWIGIGIEKGERGVLIREVYSGTPAAAAGLKKGDEVLAIDGVAVKAPAELIARVAEKGVGGEVTLLVWRDRRATVAIKLELAARPDELQLLRDHLVGKPAPDFALARSTGPHAARLSELKGHVVIVDFWATWCGPCRASIPRIGAWHDKYAARGLRVVGISSEEFDLLARFARDRKIPYTIASDEDGEVWSAYAVPAVPTLVVIDRSGVVRYAGVGTGDNLDAVEVAFLPLLDDGKPPARKK